LLGLKKSGEKVGYFAIQSENWVCWSYGEASKARWQRHGKRAESEAGGGSKERIVLSSGIDFTITNTGGAWGNATYEVDLGCGGRESNKVMIKGDGNGITAPGDPLLAIVGLNDALETEDAACRAICVESFTTASNTSKSEQVEKREAFDTVLSIHVDLFEKQQLAVAEALKLFVVDERVKFEAAQNEIDIAYAEYCEREVHCATEALMSKVRALRDILMQGGSTILQTGCDSSSDPSHHKQATAE